MEKLRTGLMHNKSSKIVNIIRSLKPQYLSLKTSKRRGFIASLQKRRGYRCTENKKVLPPRKRKAE